MSSAATIHLMCGLVAAGKTTLARRLAGDLPAVRLSRDEWMIRLYGLPHDDPAYIAKLEPCTELLWDVAFEIVAAGSDVILDWNFWSRKRRAEARRRSETAGFPVQLHWLDVPVEEVVARASARLTAAPADAHLIDEDGVRQFLTIFQPPADDEGLPLTRHE